MQKYDKNSGPVVVDKNTPQAYIDTLMTEEEWTLVASQKTNMSFEEYKEQKLQDIRLRADQVCEKLKAKYSSIEEQTWPEQEAGARAITGLVNGGQSSRAWFILQDEEQTNKAKTFVADLAKLAGVSPQQYAERILKNASNYTEKSKQILYQEIALKAQLNAADTIEKIEAINVFYPE